MRPEARCRAVPRVSQARAAVLALLAPLALLGSAMLAITATLGGHLSGIYSEVSTLLSLVGWEVYKTHYVPDAGLAAFGIIVILLLTLAVWSRSKLR